jgi:cell division protein FtsI (penicillin-binding protein 3)
MTRRRNQPAPLRGTPKTGGAMPRMETVQITAPDLQRRAAMDLTRRRLVFTAGAFSLLFGGVTAKLVFATVLFPMAPSKAEMRPVIPADPGPAPVGDAVSLVSGRRARATITDRNGEILAVSLPMDALYADPAEMIDPADAAHKLKQILPRLNEAEAAARLSAPKPMVALDRDVNPDEERAVTALHVPGLYFRDGAKRELYANPGEMADPAAAMRKLKAVLPPLDEAMATAHLKAPRQFVYLERQITPDEEQAINALGIPGIYFQPGEKRRYPLGRVAAQVLGGVDVDSHGVAGVEKAFDKRLETDSQPLRLSIDVRVQAVMRDELDKAKEEFQAIGACGIVMDVRTGEVLAMVSLPDYDANQFGETPPDDRFNRAVTGMYEPGSTFKLQTASMALDFGTAHIWDEFDAAHDIKIGRFTITDSKGKHRMLFLPEVLAYSSNLGAAHIALGVGPDRQRTWLRAMGMFSKVGIQLPEEGLPIVPPASNWKEATTMTVGFGHGIAVSPLHVVRGTAALANGGIVLNPTILALDPDAPLPNGRHIMNVSTSDTIRKLMRLVVTDGYGKPADIPGYFVGGKTGTAEKVGAHGYKKHANVSAFMSVFPMNAPRYAVYFMLDEPKGNKETGGYSTAGQVSAPGAGRVIARIAPMLGMFPDLANEDTIQAGLTIPMEPARGSGERTGTGSPLEPFLPPATTAAALPALPTRRDLLALRHEAAFHPAAGRTNADYTH